MKNIPFPSIHKKRGPPSERGWVGALARAERGTSRPIKHRRKVRLLQVSLQKNEEKMEKRVKKPQKRAGRGAEGSSLFLGGHTKEPARLWAGTMTGTAPARARLEGGGPPGGATGCGGCQGAPLVAGGCGPARGGPW